MPVIRDPKQLPARRGSIYPAPYSGGFDGRVKRALTEALGLTQFGVNLTTIEPGSSSALRHWHSGEDEAIYVLEGELVLVTNEGEQVLAAGAVAGFPRNDRNGHHLVNRSGKPATYLEIGTRTDTEDVDYPDVDLRLEKRNGARRFVHKTGEPYT